MAWENTKKYILHNLGYPVVSVELTEAQLETCIQEACERWFEFFQPVIKYHKFQIQAGVDTYDLPPEALKQTPQGIKALSVIFKPTNFEMFQYYFQYVLYNYKPINLAQIYMMFMNLETFQWITGQYVSWRIIEGKKIQVYPMPVENCPAVLIYTVNSPEGDLDQNLWIQKFALAKAKQMLGIIRGKFSIPSPAGDGSLSTNAERLLSDGKEEEEKLYNELRDKSPVGGIIVG